ncbi:MAG: PKD domain-containing protein [Sphingobacteriales bacterium]|nr:PKD domain-containing protein [Sphingobacteriales bacterium]
MRRLILLCAFALAAVLYGMHSYCQDFSNKGKEFWLAYCYHVSMINNPGNGPTMTLYITSDVATAYTVEVYGVTTIQTGNITAGQVIQVQIPTTYWLDNEGLFTGKAIHVTATKNIAVYAYITRQAISGATLCLPVPVLGKEYFSANFTQVSNETNSNSYFTIVAVEDNTTVEITPKDTTKGGWLPNVTYTQTLNKGQIYQVMGKTTGNTGKDLSGSYIKSVSSGPSGCKRIAVFSGSGKIKIPGACASSTSDNLYQQLYPVASWGKNYLTVPSYNRPANYYRIIRSTPTANVYLNGGLIPAASFTNEYFQFFNNTPNSITSDQPIAVFQYFTTQNCDGNSGVYDPDMIALNPVEQNISNVTLVSSNLVATPPEHHLHVILKNAGSAISSFRLDNAVPPGSWVTHPANPAYSYLYLANVAQGYHTLTSDSGFLALAYGYAQFESYGYSAGANVKDLYQYVTIQNQYATVNFPATCKNTPFYFSMTFPYQPTQIQWIFGPALNAMGIADVTLGPPAPTPTSIIVVNGKTLYVYQLPTPYIITASGTYPIQVNAVNPTPDGCGGAQEINYDLQVFDPPTADFTFTSNGCVNQAVAFFDNSNTGGRPIISRYWNFGDASTSTVNNPTHLYATPGAYNVKYAIITDVGCLSDTAQHIVTLNPLPTASISGSTAVCLNAPSPDITFTGTAGTAPFTFTYNINGGPNQTVVSTGNSVTVSVPTNVAGTFVYNLVSIQNGTTSPCTNLQTGSATVIVNPLPTAGIAGTIEVCVNAPSPNITFTGAAGTAPYTFTYTINGGPNQTVVSVGNTATVAVPTTTAGTFTYTLISVQDASTTFCSQLQTGSAIVTVNPLPTATISGTIAVCVNAPSPNITFNGAGGTAPYTFTYTINGGPNQTVVSVGNTATVSVPTTTAGIFTYTLISVQDASNTLCSQLQTGSAIVTVNPLPTANISGTIAVCVNATAPVITFTGGAGTAPYTFTYTINGGPNQTVVSVGNTATVTAPTTTAGTFTYTLISVQDASTTLCSQLQSGTAIVTVNPLPTASISGDAEVCLNAPSPVITFTGAAGTSPYTFTYNINGGPNLTVVSSGNIATVNAPTNVAGTFNYNLISVQDASTTLCSQLQTGTVTVIVNPLPTSNFNFTIPSCETRTISFTDLSVPNVGNIITWQWDFGDGSPVVTINAPASPNVTHTFATAGTYNVSLVVTTDKGCVSITPAQQVVIHARPLAGYIIPEVCLNDTYAQFIDTSKVAPPDIITAWQWDFGDPVSGPLNTSVLQNPQHSYSAVGSYNVQLIATSNNGCRDTITQVLFINGSFPVAGFTVQNPATLCANDSVAIAENSTVFPGTITKVEIYWDNVGQPAVFDTDNFPVAGKIYKHLYPNFQAPLTRVFTIRYRAYSGGVCVDDTLRNITVNAAPLVQFNNMPDVCLDAASFQITQASETGGVPGTGVFSGPGVSPGGIFNPASVGPGTYTLTYTFTSTAAGCRDSLSNTITVWEPPVADFSSSTPACETKAITFTDNSNTPVGTLTTWTWDFGDGSPVVVRNNNLPFTHTYAAWGTYTVTLFVTTSNGCRSVLKSMSITINPQPRPNFSTPASSCLPDATVPFTNLTTIADGSLALCTYLWDFGDPGSGANNTSTLANPSHVYTGTGPFNVYLQVTSNNGCVQDTSIALTTVHPQPLASFITDITDVCIGSAITFTNTSDPMDGTITQYNWTMGDGNIMSTPSFAYTYSALGTYNVSLFIFNSHGCRSTTFSKTVFVNPYPPVNAGPDKFMLEGGQVMLTPVLTATMPVTYLWSPPQYLSDPAIPNTIAFPPDDKYYTLTITTDKGCSASDIVFIKVLKLPAIPNIFSPNGDGVHDKWVIDYLESYPGCTVDIYNRYGQHIYHSEGYANPWDGTISGKPVPIGTYYYIVNPKNGRKIMSGYVDVIR